MKCCKKLDQCMPFGMRRILGVLFGITEMLFFGGIMYGFPALFTVLKRELIFANLCVNTTSTQGCIEQSSMYANAFTTFSVTQMVFLVLVGYLIDKVGLRAVKIGSSVVYFLGTLMFAFTNPAISPLIFVAGVFTAVGGMGMLICNLSISQLFTKSSVFVLALITGSYDSSSALFAVISLTYDAGISFRNTFLILGFCGLGMGIFSALFVTTNKLTTMSVLIPNPDDVGSSLFESDLQFNTRQKNKIKQWDEPDVTCSFEERVQQILSEMHPSTKSALISSPFWILTFYFSLSLLRFTFFLAQLIPSSLAHYNDTRVSDDLGQMLSFSLAGGILGGIICGFTIDKMRSMVQPKLEYLFTLKRTPISDAAVQWLCLRPMAISMYIMASFSLCVSVLVFIKDLRAYYVNFFFLVVMRGFIFSTFSSSILAAFPVAQFGTLYGIGGAISGAFSCFQYVLLLPAPLIGNGIALGISVCIFLPATFILVKSVKLHKKALQSDAGDSQWE